MEDFIFYEGIAPPDFTIDYEISLYNLPIHRFIQSPSDWISYYILEKKKKIIIGEVHFHLADFVASSPCRSPFGSIDCSADIQPIVLYKFLEFIESALRKQGVKKIVIKNPPQIYHPYLLALLETFLINQHYHISNAEVSAVFTVDESFHELSKDWERRKRKQSREESLTFREHTPDQLEELCRFILECRQQKGYLSSMSFPEIQKTVNAFPQRFLLTGVYKQDKMVAASISIQSTWNILYHFYSDHAAPDDLSNPTIFLIGKLYQYALDNKIALLDLGTSALAGQPNFGLLNFKLRLGAKPTPKLTFEKILN